MNSKSLTRFAWLAIGGAVVTIALKATAYFLTGSVGLLSDALESVVNLVAAVIALAALTIAQKPPDEEHSYGHTKAEYFSSIIEGVLIIVAAVVIGYAAVERLINPQAIEQVSLGLIVAAVASIINFVIARQLLNAGKKYHSITLEADAHHLFTDVWTSVGVIVGVGIVALTGITMLDPIIALLIALNIVYTGYQLIKRSALGFMDNRHPAGRKRPATLDFGEIHKQEYSVPRPLDAAIGGTEICFFPSACAGNMVGAEGTRPRRGGGKRNPRCDTRRYGTRSH